MKARYSRLFTDERGASSLENLEIDMAMGFLSSPAAPMHSAPFLMSKGATFWVGSTSDWNGGDPHPAPKRMIYVTVRGEYKVAATDGNTRSFPAGSVLVVGDTASTGHTTKMSGEDGCVIFAVELEAT